MEKVGTKETVGGMNKHTISTVFLVKKLHLLYKSPKIKSPQPNKGGKVSANKQYHKACGN